MKECLLHFALLSCFCFACSPHKTSTVEEVTIESEDSLTQISATIDTNTTPAIALSDTAFVQLTELSDQFAYDMKYATMDNFLKEKVYPCAACLLRNVVAQALIQANDSLQQLGFRILLFDCYRPLDVQQKMWAIYPNPGYVANPKYGSVHNRGAAVDMGLVNEQLVPLDMGTAFDHFGVEAHHAYTQFPEDVLHNRQLLKGVMEHFGFQSIKTEWWHYNYGDSKRFQVSNFPLPCK